MVVAWERTLVSEWELRRTLEAEALEVTGEEVLGVGRLQAHRAAGQSYLADEAILLDHTDRELVLTSREAALVLQADACAATIAENLNVLEVASRVAADASGVHEVGHGDGVLRRAGRRMSVPTRVEQAFAAGPLPHTAASPTGLAHLQWMTTATKVGGVAEASQKPR